MGEEEGREGGTVEEEEGSWEEGDGREGGERGEGGVGGEGGDGEEEEGGEVMSENYRTVGRR